jgi:hypothetical protein
VDPSVLREAYGALRLRRDAAYAAGGIGGITSAILDRLLHHAETVPIEGKSYRAKDRGEPQD